MENREISNILKQNKEITENDEENKWEIPNFNYSYVEMGPEKNKNVSSPTIERIKNIQNLGKLMRFLRIFIERRNWKGIYPPNIGQPLVK